MYRYEAHLHTAESSECGKVPACRQVETYRNAGYDGICVTDHFHQDYFRFLGHEDDWHAFVERWLLGFREAHRAGKEMNMQVILGAEFRFPQNERDYLVYGITEEWLHDNPYSFMDDAETFYRKHGGEVLIIHAHPFRYNDEVLIQAIHGVEIVNCNPRHDSRNEMALQLAIEHKNLIRTVGSDAHRPDDSCMSAVCCEELIRDSIGYRELMQGGAFSLWCPSGEDILRKSEASKNV